jgi:dsDNA-binding SOS-regulon protein
MLKEKLEKKFIDFEGGQILGVKDEEGKVWLGIKKACLDIGLSEDQAKNEIKKIQENLLFKRHDSVKKLSVKFDTQVRETIVLLESDVTMWLGQIALTPKMKKENPEAVDKLLNYQDKCAKVLYQAFFETEEQKENLFDELGLTGEIKELKTEVNGLTIELKGTQDKLSTLIDNSTINSRQASKILLHAKDRVNCLLGGANSKEYKNNSRKYFKNLWNDVAERFEVATYKDLNPLDFGSCTTYITGWSYR